MPVRSRSATGPQHGEDDKLEADAVPICTTPAASASPTPPPRSMPAPASGRIGSAASVRYHFAPARRRCRARDRVSVEKQGRTASISRSWSRCVILNRRCRARRSTAEWRTRFSDSRAASVSIRHRSSSHPRLFQSLNLRTWMPDGPGHGRLWSSSSSTIAAPSSTLTDTCHGRRGNDRGEQDYRTPVEEFPQRSDARPRCR